MKIPGMLATVQFAEDFGKAVMESLKDAWIALKGYFNKAVDWVVGLLDKVSFDFDSDDMVKVFTDFYDDMIKGFSKFFGRAWDGIKKIFGIEDTVAIPMSSQGGTPQGAAQGGSTWYNPSTWGGGDDKKDAAPDPTLAAIKTIAKTSTPEEAAQAEVNAAASKKKRDQVLAAKHTRRNLMHHDQSRHGYFNCRETRYITSAIQCCNRRNARYFQNICWVSRQHRF